MTTTSAFISFVYAHSLDSALLEQYKLYVQSAENVSVRRYTSLHPLSPELAQWALIWSFET